MTAPALELTTTDLARLVDHTLLVPDATRADIAAHVEAAKALGVFAICVSPSMLPFLGDGPGAIDTGDVAVATVVGFPSGKHRSSVKAAEAAQAAADGAHEVDMVIDVGAARAGRFDLVEADIRAVRTAAPHVLLKVIVESAALSDEQVVAACRAAEAAGADYVKTSTGFHPAGGASERAVELMAQTVGGRLGVKASGGIRTREQAERMITAGATRLGLSGTAAVLAGEPAPGRSDSSGY